MDLAYVYCTGVPDGRGTFYSLPVVRMAKMFAETDDSVHVVAIGDLETASLEEHGATCHVYERRLAFLGLLGFYLQLAYVVYRLDSRYRFDAVSNIWAHYHLLPVMVATWRFDTAVFARVFGQGNLWSRDRANDPLDVKRPRRTALMVLVRFLNRYERRLLNAVHRVYTNSNGVRETLVGQGVERSNVVVISQGVDTTYFTPGDGEPRETLLFAGRLDSENKRLDDAVRVFESVQTVVPSARFIVAGEGDPPPGLAERIAENDGIEHRGFLKREAMREAYREASVLVLTSELEGVPNVILEAQACGTPVVATDAGDVSRLLKNGGDVVMDRDIREMADQVVRILTDDDLRRSLGRQGRASVTEEHSLDRLADSYRTLFTRTS